MSLRRTSLLWILDYFILKDGITWASTLASGKRRKWERQYAHMLEIERKKKEPSNNNWEILMFGSKAIS